MFNQVPPVRAGCDFDRAGAFGAIGPTASLLSPTWGLAEHDALVQENPCFRPKGMALDSFGFGWGGVLQKISVKKKKKY